MQEIKKFHYGSNCYGFGLSGGYFSDVHCDVNSRSRRLTFPSDVLLPEVNYTARHATKK